MKKWLYTILETVTLGWVGYSVLIEHKTGPRS
jgi:hypothetical protein